MTSAPRSVSARPAIGTGEHPGEVEHQQAGQRSWQSVVGSHGVSVGHGLSPRRTAGSTTRGLLSAKEVMGNDLPRRSIGVRHGGGSGIGLGCAARLLARRRVGHDHRAERGHAAGRGGRAWSRRHLTAPPCSWVGIGRRATRRRSARRGGDGVEATGGLDIAVASAGTGSVGPVTSFPSGGVAPGASTPTSPVRSSPSSTPGRPCNGRVADRSSPSRRSPRR